MQSKGVIYVLAYLIGRFASETINPHLCRKCFIDWRFMMSFYLWAKEREPWGRPRKRKRTEDKDVSEEEKAEKTEDHPNGFNYFLHIYLGLGILHSLEENIKKKVKKARRTQKYLCLNRLPLLLLLTISPGKTSLEIVALVMFTRLK